MQRLFHSPPGSTGLVVDDLNSLERKDVLVDDRVVRGGRHIEASVPDVRRMFLSACDRCAPGFADVRLIAVVAGQPVDHTRFFISVRAVLLSF